MMVFDGIRRTRLARVRVLLGALVLAAAVPAWAQTGDSIRVARAVTPFEVEVERLARELVERRNVAMALHQARQRLLVTLKQHDIADGERVSVANSLRGVEVRLANLEGERASLRRALEGLCSQRKQPQGWMGVNFSSDFTLTSTPNGFAITHFKAHPSIESVEPNSPAERAGIERGDVLLNLAGRDLADAEVVFGEMLRPGARLALKLKRGVEMKTVTVLVEPRPSDFEVPCVWVDEMISSARAPLPTETLVRVPAPGAPPRVIIRNATPRSSAPPSAGGFSYMLASPGSSDWAAGAHVIPLNEDLAQLVAVERGVFVVEVTRRSPAAQSGLRSGDVIVSAEGRRLNGPQQLRQIMEQSEAKEISLQVMRAKKTVTVVLKWSD